MSELGATMRVLRPYPHVFGFYDGRIPGARAFSDAPNWLDDGAYTLGICSYAIVDAGEALVYDTHISLSHARLIRETLAQAGVSRVRVVLSHWHDDHVAGNEMFADCEIIACAATERALLTHRDALESGTPPIKPLIMPTSIFDRALDLTIGSLAVQLRHAEIHSDDAALMLLPDSQLFFAGDALEDSVTYVAEPNQLRTHLAELDRIAGWDFAKILPNHGEESIIAAGGYDATMIDATKQYVQKLLRLREEPELRNLDLSTFGASSFATGGASYFAPYEAVHQQNVKAVLGAKNWSG